MVAQIWVCSAYVLDPKLKKIKKYPSGHQGLGD